MEGEPRQTSFLGVDELPLMADLFGRNSSRPVVFAHGGGQTRHAWRKTGGRLATLDFQSVCIDLRGHGDSGWCPNGDYRIEAFAEDLIRVSQTLETPPALVGASLGGIAAMVAAGELHPGVFSAVVFVDVTPHMEMSGIEKIVGFMTEHVDQGFESLSEAAEVISSYLPHRPKPKNLSGLEKNLKVGDDGRFRWHWDPRFVTGMNRPSASRDPERLANALTKIDVPVMLVRGQMSELVSQQSVEQFLKLKPTATLCDVADASHMVAGDDNDAFTDAVAEFLLTATDQAS